MKKTKLLIAIFLTLLVLNACGTIAEGLGGRKKQTSEEFLIKKKAPLVLPPSFEDLPKPGKKTDENVVLTKDNASIEKIINQSSSSNKTKKNDDLTNSTEDSIIEKIKKQKIKRLYLETDLDKTKEEKVETSKKNGFFQKLKTKFKNLDH